MYNNPYNFYPYMNGINTANAVNAIRGSNAFATGMNGFNPAATTLSGAFRTPRVGLFNTIKNIKWGSILTNTQKTLNVINQAIPVYYQIKPIANNLRSFGKIMSAFNSPDSKSSNNNNSVNTNPTTLDIEKKDQKGLPTFFID